MSVEAELPKSGDFFLCTVVMETENAYLVRLNHNGREQWVPKKVCSIGNVEPDQKLMEVKHWFAKKEKLNGGTESIERTVGSR